MRNILIALAFLIANLAMQIEAGALAYGQERERETSQLVEGETIGVHLSTPSGWSIVFHRNGSVSAQYGSLPGDSATQPKGTVDFAALLKAVERLRSEHNTGGSQVGIHRKGTTSTTASYLKDDTLFRYLIASYSDTWKQTSFGDRFEELLKKNPIYEDDAPDRTRAQAQVEVTDRDQSNIEVLKKKRVALLEERVSRINKWVEQKRVGASELIRPEMDVINVKLEYATTDAERKKLLGELLSKYDMLIKLAEFRISEPPQSDSDNPNWQLLADSELLHLKSERIRIQILHDSIDGVANQND
jgi:hypothetical protein